MDRLRLDYQRREAPLPRLGLLLLLIALGAAIAGGDYYLRLAKQVSDWETNAAQLENAAKRHGILVRHGGRDEADYGEEIRHANTVLRQLTLPWDQLFDTIETVGGKNVALLSLAPDAEKRLVRISIEAKDVAAALDYLRSLEAREIFQDVQLHNHHIQLQDPEKPVRFTLQATWRGLP